MNYYDNEEDMDHDVWEKMIDNKIDNFSLFRIERDENERSGVDEELLEKYFESLGYPGEEDNIINGEGWNCWIHADDYQEFEYLYRHSHSDKESVKKFRMKIKKQIKEFLNGEN